VDTAITGKTHGQITITGNTRGQIAITGNTCGHIAITGNTRGHTAITGTPNSLNYCEVFMVHTVYKFSRGPHNTTCRAAGSRPML